MIHNKTDLFIVNKRCPNDLITHNKTYDPSYTATKNELNVVPSHLLSLCHYIVTGTNIRCATKQKWKTTRDVRTMFYDWAKIWRLILLDVRLDDFFDIICCFCKGAKLGQCWGYQERIFDKQQSQGLFSCSDDTCRVNIL